jgi:hypothetical protein
MLDTRHWKIYKGAAIRRNQEHPLHLLSNLELQVIPAVGLPVGEATQTDNVDSPAGDGSADVGCQQPLDYFFVCSP